MNFHLAISFTFMYCRIFIKMIRHVVNRVFFLFFVTRFDSCYKVFSVKNGDLTNGGVSRDEMRGAPGC